MALYTMNNKHHKKREILIETVNSTQICFHNLFLQHLNVNCKERRTVLCDVQNCLLKTMMQCQHFSSTTDIGNGDGLSTTHYCFPWVISILLVSFNYCWQKCITNRLDQRYLICTVSSLISVTSCSLSSSFSLLPLFLDTHKAESLKDNSSFKNTAPLSLIKP